MRLTTDQARVLTWLTVGVRRRDVGTYHLLRAMDAWEVGIVIPGTYIVPARRHPVAVVDIDHIQDAEGAVAAWLTAHCKKG